MELQKFIDIHKQYFESIDGEALVKNCMMLRTIYGLKINGPVGRKYEDLDTRIFENSATSKYIFFEVIGNIFPLIETYDKFKDQLLKLIDYIKTCVSTEPFNESNKQKLDLASKIYCLLFANDLHRSAHEGESITVRWEKLKNIFEILFLEYFDINLTKIKDVYTKVATIIGTRININISSVEASPTMHEFRDTVYLIYYIKYTYGDKEYKNIIYITKKNSNITKYGLNDRYVSAGIFINKPFDYKIQTNHTVGTDDPIGMGPREYNFIGKFTSYNFLP